MSRGCLLMLAALALAPLSSQPAAGQPSEPSNVARYETALPIARYALVVGTQNYREHDPVPNAINDAQVIGHALERTRRFSHIRVLPDAEVREDILAAIDEVVSRADEEAATIVFYFAGHGFQFDGANYLVPSRAGKPVRNPSTREMDKEPLVRASLNIATVTERLRTRRAGATILFIDACRTHILGVNAVDPAAEPKGFLRFPDPQGALKGALISFSTGFDDVAQSHSKDTPNNSPYASVLSENLTTPAVPLNPTLLGHVQSMVRQATGHQTPEPLNPYAAGIYFYFQPTPTELEAELKMWRKAVTTGTKNCMDAFLHYYRDGHLSRHVSVYLTENPIAPSNNPEPLCDLLR